jgi:hypothetical protein
MEVRKDILFFVLEQLNEKNNKNFLAKNDKLIIINYSTNPLPGKHGDLQTS